MDSVLIDISLQVKCHLKQMAPELIVNIFLNKNSFLYFECLPVFSKISNVFSQQKYEKICL